MLIKVGCVEEALGKAPLPKIRILESFQISDIVLTTPSSEFTDILYVPLGCIEERKCDLLKLFNLNEKLLTSSVRLYKSFNKLK